MKAMAESLQARGFDVTVLRLPGHGTMPSMMTAMSLNDWRAAVRIAARDVAARASNGQPYYIGGYSNGGTLALLHMLETLRDPSLCRPDRVLLVSPAIELAPVAALAEMTDLFSVQPIPVLDKVRWPEVLAKYDPYKFNSFPVNASRQVNRATRALKQALADAAASDRIDRMPPVATWQSVVDATVGSAGVADTLYARLRGPAQSLALFDVNRQPALASVMQPRSNALLERLSQRPQAYTLNRVTDTGPLDAQVSVVRTVPNGTLTTRKTDLAWPVNSVSLGHVALPFRPDDPVYGFTPGSGRAAAGPA